VLYLVQAVFNTGAGINVKREDMFPAGWENMILTNVALPPITNDSGHGVC
jgi:hypothetical protein